MTSDDVDFRNQQEQRVTLEDVDFDYEQSDSDSDGCNTRIEKWSGWRGGLDGKIVVNNQVFVCRLHPKLSSYKLFDVNGIQNLGCVKISSYLESKFIDVRH